MHYMQYLVHKFSLERVNMRKIVLIATAVTSIISAQVNDKEIANMFMLGFYGTSANDSAIKSDICKGLGGVIVFQKSPVNRNAAKNFTNANSLRTLTSDLKSCGTKPLIAVDQEGGVVQRIKFSYRYPKATTIAKMGHKRAYSIYYQMGKELKNLGLNLNLAPVVDLAINPNNRVIVKLGRSYGKRPADVINYAAAFIDAMHANGILTSIKHFPGHGSSLGDTHKGFVDVTNLWQKKELEPYKALKGTTDTVMVAHIFNRKLDSKYPASLSRNIVTNKLRGEIGYHGVVITDDLQMGAIAKHYSLASRIALAINAGDDILLFANQVHPKRVIKIEKLISIVRSLLNSGKISEVSIKNANARINTLKKGLN